MNNIICDKCKTWKLMYRSSFGTCKMCKKKIFTPHVPSYVICDKCAKENNKCKQCGEDM